MNELAARITSKERSFDDECDGVFCGRWDASCFVHYFSALLPAPLRTALLPTGRLPLKPFNSAGSPPFLNEKR